MNDDFLNHFRQAPRSKFAQELYAELAKEPEARQPAIRRTALVLAAIGLAFLLTLAVSPAARAAIADLYEKITVRGLTVVVNDDYPLMSGEGESYSEIWTPVTPEEISADFPFYAKLPAWIPPGYRLQERAALYYGSMYAESPDSALVQWKNRKKETIQLNVFEGSCPGGAAEGLTGDCTLQTFISLGQQNQPEVITVAGQPAVFFRGVLGLADLSGTVREWNPSRGMWNTDPEAGLSMYWEKDGRTFELIAASRSISREDFIRIAESIP